MRDREAYETQMVDGHYLSPEYPFAPAADRSVQGPSECGDLNEFQISLQSPRWKGHHSTV